MADSTPLINGVRHGWASLAINILGRTVTGIDSVAYESMRKKENHFGAGSNPVHRGSGNNESKATIGLYKYEVEALQAIAPGGDITKLPMFDIPVVYLPEGADSLKTDVIRNAEFTANKRDMKQGDTKIGTTYDLIVSHIDWAK